MDTSHASYKNNETPKTNPTKPRNISSHNTHTHSYNTFIFIVVVLGFAPLVTCPAVEQHQPAGGGRVHVQGPEGHADREARGARGRVRVVQAAGPGERQGARTCKIRAERLLSEGKHMERANSKRGK